MSENIVIDGNIGSGKSTLLVNLTDNFPDRKIFLEDVDSFKPWLKLFYKNMGKYALGFQMEVLFSHMQRKKYLHNSEYGMLFERSTLSCINVFGKYLLENNILSMEEQNLCIKYDKEYGWKPHTIIYINTDPNNCFDRIHKRNRDGESSISLEYLKDLDKLYRKLYIDNNSNEYNLHIVDGNKSPEEVLNSVVELINKI